MSYSIPFEMKVSDYSKLEGMLTFEDGALEIEFYKRETVLNVFGSSRREVPISLLMLREFSHKKGWFGDRIILAFKSLEDAEKIPGARLGKLSLKVSKSDRKNIEAMLVDYDLARAEQNLAEFERRR